MSVMSFETLVSVLIEITDELDSFPSSFKVGGILYTFGHTHIDVNVILGPHLFFKDWRSLILSLHSAYSPFGSTFRCSDGSDFAINIYSMSSVQLAIGIAR